MQEIGVHKQRHLSEVPSDIIKLCFLYSSILLLAFHQCCLHNYSRSVSFT